MVYHPTRHIIHHFRKSLIAHREQSQDCSFVVLHQCCHHQNISTVLDDDLSLFSMCAFASLFFFLWTSLHCSVTKLLPFKGLSITVQDSEFIANHNYVWLHLWHKNTLLCNYEISVHNVCWEKKHGIYQAILKSDCKHNHSCKSGGQTTLHSTHIFLMNIWINEFILFCFFKLVIMLL